MQLAALCAYLCSNVWTGGKAGAVEMPPIGIKLRIEPGVPRLCLPLEQRAGPGAARSSGRIRGVGAPPSDPDSLA